MIKVSKETRKLCGACKAQSLTKIRIRSYPFNSKEFYLCKDCTKELITQLSNLVNGE